MPSKSEKRQIENRRKASLEEIERVKEEVKLFADKKPSPFPKTVTK